MVLVAVREQQLLLGLLLLLFVTSETWRYSDGWANCGSRWWRRSRWAPPS